MKNGGFTLLEVLVSIAILSAILISVFYFYSGSISNHKKLNEKYSLLRVSREFIDNFQEIENFGKNERDGFLLEWEVFPIEEPRKILRAEGGINSFLQLKLVHLNVIRKGDEQNLLSLNFIYNAVIPVKE